MAFEAITTQEAFDAAIKARLERNSESVRKEVEAGFQGFVSPDDHKKALAALEEKLNGMSALETRAKTAEAASMRLRVAARNGIPFDLADRLVGDTEDAVQADAELMLRHIGGHSSTPMRSTEDTKPAAGHEQMLQVLRSLKE